MAEMWSGDSEGLESEQGQHREHWTRSCLGGRNRQEVMLEWILEESRDDQGSPKTLAGDKVGEWEGRWCHHLDGDPGARNLFWGRF